MEPIVPPNRVIVQRWVPSQDTRLPRANRVINKFLTKRDHLALVCCRKFPPPKVAKYDIKSRITISTWLDPESKRSLKMTSKHRYWMARPWNELIDGPKPKKIIVPVPKEDDPKEIIDPKEDDPKPEEIIDPKEDQRKEEIIDPTEEDPKKDIIDPKEEDPNKEIIDPKDAPKRDHQNAPPPKKRRIVFS